MFKPQLSIPGQESIELNKKFFDEMIIPFIAKSALTNTGLKVMQETLSINMDSNVNSLREGLVTLQQSYDFFKELIYNEFIRIQFEEYIEAMPVPKSNEVEAAQV